MEKQTKLQQQELQQLQELQQQEKQIITQLGIIEVEKLNIKIRQREVHNMLAQIQQQSEALAQHLEQIYGKCSIDIDTGEIIPI
jgi:response regulator RpfG family c-di-GMP phosphodiesterase